MASIVFWTPNYEPELIGIAPLVTDAADWLTARGHGVEVVTAMPNYPERLVHDAYRKKLSVDEWIRGLSVHRTWLRVRPGESFLDKALYERPSPRPRRARLCAARSATTSWSAWCRRSPPQRSPRLHIARHGSCSWVQDLVAPLTRTVPGAARVRRRPRSSGSRPGPPARADRVVVCSVGFRDLLTASGVDNDRVVTVPNWVDTELVSPGEPPSAGRIRFLYAGNIGYTQGLETLVAAARDLDADVEIVGARNATADVRLAATGLPNVRIRPPVPRDQLPALLDSAHVLVVMRRRAEVDANLPSKIATYFAAGRPLLASVAQASTAGELLARSGGALLVEPESPEALAEGMARLRDDPGLRLELGRRGRAFAELELSRDRLLPQLEAALLG